MAVKLCLIVIRSDTPQCVQGNHLKVMTEEERPARLKFG
jgi:hypothetical protein